LEELNQAQEDDDIIVEKTPPMGYTDVPGSDTKKTHEYIL